MGYDTGKNGIYWEEGTANKNPDVSRDKNREKIMHLCGHRCTCMVFVSKCGQFGAIFPAMRITFLGLKD